MREDGKGKIGGTSGVDELGRSFGLGRRKESSARVWIIPTKGSRSLLDVPSSSSPSLQVPTTGSNESPETESSTSSDPDSNPISPLSPSQSSTSTAGPRQEVAPAEIPTSEILINHLPLPLHFSRTYDREQILRPLKLTGLLGAFNVFALVRGGGTTGQAGAIALGLARALAEARDDVKDVLLNGTSRSRSVPPSQLIYLGVESGSVEQSKIGMTARQITPFLIGSY